MILNRSGQNPFTLSFGKRPFEYISRPVQTEQILNSFQAEHSPNQVFMITGVRGSGKTVLMSNLVKKLSEQNGWIVIELSPERDLLTQAASRLYHTSLQMKFTEAKIDLSILGIGISVKGAVPTTDIDVAIEKMLKVIQKQKKRLLITIDETVNNKHVREFASMFQIYMRQDYPLYLLMTGLYENIYHLQNEQSLTFLYRASKVILTPLNTGAIMNSYKKVFGISVEHAKHMAALTKGYPFAFQVLGYLCWEHGDEETLDEILPEFDQYLDEYVYSKMWSELSDLDKLIMKELSVSKETSVTAIRNNINMSTEKFSVYRRRLIQKGLVTAYQYGKIELALPRFDVFVQSRI